MHLEQAKLQLTREPHPLPQMKINPAVRNIHDFEFENFELVGYDPHPAIKAQIAVQAEVGDESRPNENSGGNWSRCSRRRANLCRSG